MQPISLSACGMSIGNGAEEAMSRLRVGIRRLNESHGTPNSNHEGYHETVTRAYTQLLSKYYASCPAEMSLRERVHISCAVRSRTGMRCMCSTHVRR